MLLEDMQRILPRDWYPMDSKTGNYEVFPVHPLSTEYSNVEFKILGNYYSSIKGIYKIQNPYLYTKYILKLYEYDQRGHSDILCLFHDTCSENVESIVKYNFDWRCGSRLKYGPGVYFSVSPSLANRHSFRYHRGYHTTSRSMFIVDVLVQNVQKVDGDIFLPDRGYDTVLAHNAETYVKYYDCEYYPRYVVDYVSLR